MKRMVMKFGGTSVGSAEAFERVHQVPTHERGLAHGRQGFVAGAHDVRVAIEGAQRVAVHGTPFVRCRDGSAAALPRDAAASASERADDIRTVRRADCATVTRR